MAPIRQAAKKQLAKTNLVRYYEKSAVLKAFYLNKKRVSSEISFLAVRANTGYAPVTDPIVPILANVMSKEWFG